MKLREILHESQVSSQEKGTISFRATLKVWWILNISLWTFFVSRKRSFPFWPCRLFFEVIFNGLPFLINFRSANCSIFICVFLKLLRQSLKWFSFHLMINFCILYVKISNLFLNLKTCCSFSYSMALDGKLALK